MNIPMKLTFPLKTVLTSELEVVYKEALLDKLDKIIKTYEYGTCNDYTCGIILRNFGFLVCEYYMRLIIQDGKDFLNSLESSLSTTVPFHKIVVEESELKAGMASATEVETNRIIALNLLYIAISEDWEI